MDSSVAPRVPDTSSSSTHKPLRLSYITHALARETGIDLGSTIDVCSQITVYLADKPMLQIKQCPILHTLWFSFELVQQELVFSIHEVKPKTEKCMKIGID